MNHVRTRLLALILLAAGGGAAAAAEKAPTPSPAPGGVVWKTGSEPIQIDSRTLETFSGGELVVFVGDVTAKQGEVTLHSDRLEVTVDKQTKAARIVKAHGNVRIRKEEVVATGKDAVYDAQTGVTVLTGDPKVWRDRDVVVGDKITLYMAEDRTVVEGAKAVLYQQQSGEKPPATKPPVSKPEKQSSKPEKRGP